MPKIKKIRMALIGSVISLLLCCTMLIGTTYAWFTDSVTSANNKIIAGNLDIEMYRGDEVLGDSKLFANYKWEPGMVAYENVTVKNIGTLALEYELSLKCRSFNTLAGNDRSLRDVLKAALVEGGVSDTLSREDVIDLVGDKFLSIDDCLVEGELPEGGDSKDYAIVIYWQPSADDDTYNLKKDIATSDLSPYLYIDLGVDLVAAQLVHEEDSFDKTYDEGADLGDPDNVKTLTPADLTDGVFTVSENGVYSLEGSFTPNASGEIFVNIPAGADVVLDGEKADLGGAKLIVCAPGVLGSYNELTTQKNGSVTVNGFADSELIAVFAYNTSVNITNNTTQFISVTGGNVKMNISSNNVDAKSVSHSAGINSLSSEHGVYLYVTEYELVFNDNTVKNMLGHGLAILGRQSEEGGFATGGAANKISEFSRNNISVTTVGKAAIKIWADGAYAPQFEDHSKLTDSAKEFIDLVKVSGNTFTEASGIYIFSIYDVKLENYSY